MFSMKCERKVVCTNSIPNGDLACRQSPQINAVLHFVSAFIFLEWLKRVFKFSVRGGLAVVVGNVGDNRVGSYRLHVSETTAVISPDGSGRRHTHMISVWSC